jgi:hypothetical protein
MGATVAVACLIRPSSYFLFASLVVVPFLVRQQRYRSAAIAIGSAALVFSAGALASYAIRGVATQNLGGMAMYGHVAHLFDPAKSTLPDNIKTEAANIRDELVTKRSATQSIVDLQSVEMWNFNPALHRIVVFMPDGQQSAIFSQLSREAILGDPVGYVKTVAENVYAAYAVWSLAENGAASSALLEKLLGHSVSNHLAINTLGRFHKIPGVIPRLWILVAFAASLAVLLLRFKSPLAWIGLYAGGLHFAGITFTSIATVFIPRYASAVDAMILVTIACGVGLLLNGFFDFLIRVRLMSPGQLKLHL